MGAMSKGASFVVTFTAAPGSDGIRALRGVLKLALRRFGLRAISICEHTAPKISRSRTAQAARTAHARRQETTIMGLDMRKYSGTAFIKPGDVKAGPLRVVIVDVTEGKYGRPDLEFDDGTKLSLNATNNRTLVTAYGSNSDDFINKEIELSLGEVEYNGEMQETVIVKPISPPVEKKPPPPKPKNSSGGDMDDEVPF
jgi:hypothetical protein